MINPTAHERAEWSRMAQDAYRTGHNAYGHRYSAASAKSGPMSVQVFDSLQRVYRQWLNDGWKGDLASNPRRKRRRNPHQRRTRRARPSLRSMMHVRRGARGLTERESRRLAQFERRYDRLVGRSPNPRRKRRVRRRNPRSPLFKLLAHKRTGGKRLVYVGAAKFSEGGRPVYFKNPEGAKVVARLLRLQFPMLKRYAFSIAGA